jgi:ubiquinone/menaquinone biosynthesis C-methylase UbiE
MRSSESYVTYTLDWQRSRRLETSAGLLAPHLTRGMRLLDCGCGPGSITLDLAEALDQGEVIGIDHHAEVLEHGRRAADERGLTNVLFEVGDIYDLQLEDGSFDAVWTSSVMQWLAEPAKALAEIYRVLKPGGVYASRDRDRRGDMLGNSNPLLERAMDLHYAAAAVGDFHERCGGDLRALMVAAGFERPLSAASYENRGDQDGARWTAGFFLRALQEEYKLQYVRAHQLIELDAIRALIDAWNAWAEDPRSWYAVCRVENLAWKPAA